MRRGDQSTPILTASKPRRGERCETHRSPTIGTGPRGDPYFFGDDGHAVAHILQPLEDKPPVGASCCHAPGLTQALEE